MMFSRRCKQIVANGTCIIILSFGFVAAGHAQAVSTDETVSESTRTAEEIVVYGEKSVIILQNELYRAQENFFDMFNSINSDDEFNVVCKKRQKSIEERRKIHSCMPNFALKYAAQSAGGFYRSGMQNGLSGMSNSSFANLDYQARVKVKEKEMWAEIVELAKSDPEFREEIRKLQVAKRALDAERKSRGDCKKLFCRE